MNGKDWLSERILFGLLIIIGYLGITGLAVFLATTPEARQTAKDALLVLGPLLGVIVQAIWRTDKTDKQTADTAAVLAAKAPDLSQPGSVQVVAPAAVVPTLDPDAAK